MSCSFIQNILKLTYRTKFTIVCKIVYLIFYLAEKKNQGRKKIRANPGTNPVRVSTATVQRITLFGLSSKMFC